MVCMASKHLHKINHYNKLHIFCYYNSNWHFVYIVFESIKHLKLFIYFSPNCYLLIYFRFEFIEKLKWKRRLPKRNTNGNVNKNCISIWWLNWIAFNCSHLDCFSAYHGNWEPILYRLTHNLNITYIVYHFGW